MAPRWSELGSRWGHQKWCFSSGFYTFFARWSFTPPSWSFIQPVGRLSRLQDGAKMALRWPQDGSRWPQDGPSWKRLREFSRSCFSSVSVIIIIIFIVIVIIIIIIVIMRPQFQKEVSHALNLLLNSALFGQCWGPVGQSWAILRPSKVVFFLGFLCIFA